MTRGELILSIGVLTVGGGLYLLHPAAPAIWIGSALIGVGIAYEYLASRKPK